MNKEEIKNELICVLAYMFTKAYIIGYESYAEQKQSTHVEWDDLLDGYPSELVDFFWKAVEVGLVNDFGVNKEIETSAQIGWTDAFVGREVNKDYHLKYNVL